MRATENQIFLLWLQDPGPISRSQLKCRWEKKFGEQPDSTFMYPALSNLLDTDVLEEFDVEYSGVFDNAMAEHSEHGEIDFLDISNYFNLTELICLSKNAPKFASEHLASLTRDAAKFGLDRALGTLTSMPIDSTAWTGLPKGFAFTKSTKRQLLSMLEEAELNLSSSGLTNADIGQGVGLVRASIILINTPEPPEIEIWSLLKKGAAISSLVTFFAPIIEFLREV